MPIGPLLGAMTDIDEKSTRKPPSSRIADIIAEQKEPDSHYRATETEGFFEEYT